MLVVRRFLAPLKREGCLGDSLTGGGGANPHQGVLPGDRPRASLTHFQLGETLVATTTWPAGLPKSNREDWEIRGVRGILSRFSILNRQEKAGSDML